MAKTSTDGREEAEVRFDKTLEPSWRSGCLRRRANLSYPGHPQMTER